jgi:hypothetical protein
MRRSKRRHRNFTDESMGIILSFSILAEKEKQKKKGNERNGIWNQCVLTALFPCRGYTLRAGLGPRQVSHSRTFCPRVPRISTPGQSAQGTEARIFLLGDLSLANICYPEAKLARPDCVYTVPRLRSALLLLKWGTGNP